MARTIEDQTDRKAIGDAWNTAAPLPAGSGGSGDRTSTAGGTNWDGSKSLVNDPNSEYANPYTGNLYPHRPDKRPGSTTPIISGYMGNPTGNTTSVPWDTAADDEYQKKQDDIQQARNAGVGTGSTRGTDFAWMTNPDGSPVRNTWDAVGSLGFMRPEAGQYNAVHQGDSAMQNAQPDMRSVQGQRMAIEQLQNQYNAGGIDATSRAAMEQARRSTNQNEQAQRMALQQNMAARGMGGSGAEMAAAMQGQQSGADRLRSDQLGIDAMAQQNRQQALMNMAGVSGQMRGQSFDESSRRAESQDAINRYNAGLDNQGQVIQHGMDQQAWANDVGMYGLADAHSRYKQDKTAENARAQSAALQAIFSSIGGLGGQAMSYGLGV